MLVRSQVVGFKKIKFFTNENVGSGKLELPENEMHTTAFWLTLGHGLLAELPFQSFRASEWNLRIALCPRVHGDAAADVRSARPWHSCRRTSTQRRDRDQLGRPRSTGESRSEAKEFFEPNLYIYDAYPGGIGFSEPLYRACDVLLEPTRELISACPCENGCPSCVGPTADRSERTKEVALEILGRVYSDAQFDQLRRMAPNRMSTRYVSLDRVR